MGCQPYRLLTTAVCMVSNFFMTPVEKKVSNRFSDAKHTCKSEEELNKNQEDLKIKIEGQF